MSSAAATLGLTSTSKPQTTTTQQQDVNNRSRKDKNIVGFPTAAAVQAVNDVNALNDAGTNLTPMTQLQEIEAKTSALGNLKTYMYNPRLKQ